MATNLGSVQTQDFEDLFFASQYQYENPVGTAPAGVPLPNFIAVSRTGTWGNFNANIINKPQYVTVGEDELCYNNANSDGIKIRQVTVPVCLYKTFAEICAADIKKLMCGSQVGQSLQNVLNRSNLPTGTVQALLNSDPMAAMLRIAIEAHKMQMADDHIKATVFGSKLWASRTTTPAGLATGIKGFLHQLSSPTTISQEYEKNFVDKTLGHCDGLWGQLVLGSQATNPEVKVKFVSSNDGTAEGNPLNPLYTLAYIQGLINTLAPQYRNRQPQNVGIFVDPAVFRSLLIAIENKFTGTSEGVVLFNEGRFTYVKVRGYVVVPFIATELFDIENDAMITSAGTSATGEITHSANLRGMVLVADNLIMGMDAAVAQTGTSDAVLTVRPSVASDRTEGVIVMKSAYFSGIGIIEPKHCTVSWSTSNTFTF